MFIVHLAQHYHFVTRTAPKVSGWWSDGEGCKNIGMMMMMMIIIVIIVVIIIIMFLVNWVGNNHLTLPLLVFFCMAHISRVGQEFLGTSFRKKHAQTNSPRSDTHHGDDLHQGSITQNQIQAKSTYIDDMTTFEWNNQSPSPSVFSLNIVGCHFVGKKSRNFHYWKTSNDTHNQPFHKPYHKKKT